MKKTSSIALPHLDDSLEYRVSKNGKQDVVATLNKYKEMLTNSIKNIDAIKEQISSNADKFKITGDIFNLYLTGDEKTIDKLEHNKLLVQEEKYEYNEDGESDDDEFDVREDNEQSDSDESDDDDDDEHTPKKKVWKKKDKE